MNFLIEKTSFTHFTRTPTKRKKRIFILKLSFSFTKIDFKFDFNSDIKRRRKKVINWVIFSARQTATFPESECQTNKENKNSDIKLLALHNTWRCYTLLNELIGKYCEWKLLSNKLKLIATLLFCWRNLYHE